MSLVNKAAMTQQLILHEGLKLRPYRDTVGKVTIGVGYNVSDRGWKPLEDAIGRKVDRKRPAITYTEAIKVLSGDIETFETILRAQFPMYDTLDEIRKRVTLDLAFNLAWHLKEFVNTRAAYERGDWQTAADNLLQSKWARQVKSRATRLAEMLRTGLDYSTR
jgi:lysozyme